LTPNIRVFDFEFGMVEGDVEKVGVSRGPLIPVFGLYPNLREEEVVAPPVEVGDEIFNGLIPVIRLSLLLLPLPLLPPANNEG
jgi:hypothetical protein